MRNQFLQNVSKKALKAKGIIVASVVAVSSGVANAAVTFNPTTKALEGDLEMGTYYSGVEIALAAIAIIIGITLVFGVLKKVR